MQQSMRSQRVRHDLATEQQQRCFLSHSCDVKIKRDHRYESP